MEKQEKNEREGEEEKTTESVKEVYQSLEKRKV